MEQNLEPTKRKAGRPKGTTGIPINRTKHTREKGPKRPSRGGARPNSGRKPGSKQQLTIEGLLETLKIQANGQNYEELLVEDFMRSRGAGDTHLTMKYHNLILNKVMGTLAKVEVTDSTDNVEMKKLAFAEALAKITGIKEDK